jgi:AcrR family transcriptional regulator
LAKTERCVAAGDLNPALGPHHQDGRRLRSADSRARIIAAVLALIEEGDISPGAEAVAARAEVGLRTVFRHFKDMDSLYQEMTEVIAGEMRTAASAPFQTTGWRDRAIELVGRRADIFDRIAPFKRAADAHRLRSPVFEIANTRLVRALREIIRRELPDEVLADPVLFESLDLLLSFEVWSRLRREQGLDPAQARAVLESAVRKLLG